MKFFDSLALWFINFVKSTWAFMKMLAGMIVNGVISVLPGTTRVDDTMCAIFLYGGIIVIIVVWIWFGRALTFKQ